MPIYMKIDGIRGDVTAEGRAANGGVWKTTNFLTNDHPVGGPGGGPHVKVLSGNNNDRLSLANAIPISRISLFGGANAVDGRDSSARFKVEQLIDLARSQGSNGKLFIATDVGVYRGGKQIDPQGRLLVGTDAGVWRSAGAREAAARIKCANNLKQLGLGMHNNASVEVIVTDARGTVVATQRLEGVTVTGSGGTFTLTFKGQTTGGL